MDFDRFLRGFLNLPRRREEEPRDPFQDLVKEFDSESSEENDNSFIFSNRFGSFGHGSIFTEASEMFKHFEEMFRNIGLAEFPSSSFGIQFPQIEESNPRDKMLKIPDVDGMTERNENFPIGGWLDSPKDLESRLDTDLDDKVAKEGLSQFLKNETREERTENLPQTRSFDSFVSIRTFKSADGRTEERRTTKDGRGNVDTVIRRSVGDQTHAVTTKTDARGRVERKEEFVNLDEGALDAFERKWRPSGPPHLGDPSYFSIFRKLFGPRPDPRE